MLLDTHLRAKGLTDHEFALMIGCSRPFVTRLRHGDSLASFTTMREIERATAGQVTAVDIYEARKARLAVKPARKVRRGKSKGRSTLNAAE